MIGHANATGLGRNLNMFVEALSGFDPLVFNADDGQCVNPERRWREDMNLRARVAALCVNADRAPEMIARFASICEDAHIIGFYLWETDTPPETHLLGANAVDDTGTCPTSSPTVTARSPRPRSATSARAWRIRRRGCSARSSTASGAAPASSSSCRWPNSAPRSCARTRCRWSRPSSRPSPRATRRSGCCSRCARSTPATGATSTATGKRWRSASPATAGSRSSRAT